jgi:hypothetical protein
VRQEIEFRYHHAIGAAKHKRVFQGFIFTLGHGAQDNPKVLAQGEFSRTDQIPNIFDKQQREIAQCGVAFELRKAIREEVRIEVASAPGCDRRDRGATRAEAFGIEFGGHIAFDDGDAQRALQRRHGLFEQAGLAAAGAAHQIDATQLRCIQPRPVTLRHRVIIEQEIEVQVYANVYYVRMLVIAIRSTH